MNGDAFAGASLDGTCDDTVVPGSERWGKFTVFMFASYQKSQHCDTGYCSMNMLCAT
ncbi:hypothetical protein BBSC_2243 [Bifidobacterium scardovii JCM 12489 = DSM 13734]|nr:hypothetical protein BBSC_2243 [Bifidobacterium scardovii JCM 12489 = DSM 13734]